ncbi:nucleotidyltransferase [Heliobacillus mobilis]|uniref:Nucleotidyltransferase n=1 Tax=Heliobacterium mobile TaxID=28064 RepID=A0A6I3SHP7_HELMO|nr:nucleotidyltransferase substrate binding protein [Heliobacterium mobile]MTV48394.1 nucleotidyltransferase [Heliobacterium mobile]
MNEERVQEKLHNYQKALERLQGALNVENPPEYLYDAVIKRFEFTYEMAWKLMKSFMEYKGGADLRFPRDIFKEAYATGIIEDGEVWISMLKDRNLTSHTYDESSARSIYYRVKAIYFVHLTTLKTTLERKL